MKRILICITMCLSMAILSTGVCFANTAQSELITDSFKVESDLTNAIVDQDLIDIEKITITELSKDAFTKHSQLVLECKKELTAEGESKTTYLDFSEESDLKVLSNDTELVYKIVNGCLVITMNNSDTSTIESIEILNAALEKRTPTVFLRTYSLCLSSNISKEAACVISEFVELKEYPDVEKDTPLTIELKINEKKFKVNDEEKMLRVPAFISKTGYTMLPIREVTEVFPVTQVVWDNDMKQAVILFGAKYVSIDSNDTEMFVNGKAESLKTAAEIRDGRMFVSLRDMCKICDIPSEDILWNSATKTVTIDTEV